MPSLRESVVHGRTTGNKGRRIIFNFLSLEHRTVLLMHDQEGISCVEMARELEIPVNTVYSRVRLARDNFRKFFSQKDETP